MIPKRWKTIKLSPTATSDHCLERVPRLQCGDGEPSGILTSRVEETAQSLRRLKRLVFAGKSIREKRTTQKENS